ncbi:MAG: glycosyl transferase [Desulfuromonas sp.]|uniref:glycosyltransferase n=1 Tax=Desulfuromonas sp. TaxID=892 RepID=UPI000CA861C8|nr:glycosyltransferase [Desulfuromonas sp.]PLX84694.1 MAG: glycosyl transferase [Desulfuromonas sp.]
MPPGKTPSRPRIAVFVSFSGKGGVERMITRLCGGFIDLGCQVDLLLIKSQSEHLNELPPQVRLVKLGASHSLTCLWPLVRYLRRERPDGLLAAKDRANQVAIIARWLARVPTRLAIRMGTTISAALEGKGTLKKWQWYLPIWLLYRQADEIVGISQGVADDLASITGLPPKRFRVITNPVIDPQTGELALQEVAHRWFAPGEPPVVLGVGRLTRQKDFPTLIRAFARLREQRACRLVILGEGADRERLSALTEELGIGQDVDFPGFVANPFAYMSKASLFVLSSAWEGFGNVLAEAMSVGTPVVSTDCPSGPREMLRGGEVGPLVPVGDVAALAEAMQAVLADPPDGELLKEAVCEYTVENSSRAYLAALMGDNLPADKG